MKGYRLGLVVLLCAPIARANFTCSGPINYLALSAIGSVYVVVGNFGLWPICNITTSATNGGTTVSPEVCKAWYSTVLAQQKAGNGVALYFNSANSGANGADCTALGSWAVPNPLPYHLELTN